MTGHCCPAVDREPVRAVDCRHVDHLVVCPGIQLDWDRVAGLPDRLGRDGVSSNYADELAPPTWKFIRDLRSGTAVFAMPSGPIKCGGAPQKIAYLAADYWREQGVLSDIDVHLVLPTPRMFGVPEFAQILSDVVRRYGASRCTSTAR
jgi:sulfide:quinone oxidoreductase